VSVPAQQRGVALLAAILLVALGTIVAASIAFQSAMSARRSSANLAFEQAVLVAQGAEALAAYVLRDTATNATDDLTSEWAKPFGPLEIYPGVVLEAAIEDLNGRFNLNTLIDPQGQPDEWAVKALQNLLSALEMEPKWADQMVDWIDTNIEPSGFEGLEDNGTTTQNPPYRTPNTYITSASELLALPGFGRERYQRLAPFVTALPLGDSNNPSVFLNVCTASGVLLDAMIGEGKEEYSTDAQFTKQREKECWPRLTDFVTLLNTEANPSPSPSPSGPPDPKFEDYKSRFQEKSEYFRLRSIITLGGTEFALYSLLERRGSGSGKIRVIQRSTTPD
jgi:general secretion pathway protein K